MVGRSVGCPGGVAFGNLGLDKGLKIGLSDGTKGMVKRDVGKIGAKGKNRVFFGHGGKVFDGFEEGGEFVEGISSQHRIMMYFF
jgi:hypothetical protein